MCRVHYSIADHSTRVAQLVPDNIRFAALMHDASEAYISDISRPLKHALPQYQDIEYIIQNTIHERYGIGLLSLDDLDAIKKADNILMMTEVRDLMPSVKGWESWTTESPLPTVLEPVSPLLAYGTFLGYFNRYCRKEDRVTDIIV